MKDMEDVKDMPKFETTGCQCPLTGHGHRRSVAEFSAAPCITVIPAEWRDGCVGSQTLGAAIKRLR